MNRKSRSRSQRRRKLVLNRDKRSDRRYGPRIRSRSRTRLHPDTPISKATCKPVPFWTLKAQQEYLKKRSEGRLRKTSKAKRRRRFKA
jgi:hypothetical protein